MLKKMNKTTKNNLITYAMVILAFVIMQILISAGSISSLLQGLMVPLMHLYYSCSFTEPGCWYPGRAESWSCRFYVRWCIYKCLLFKMYKRCDRFRWSAVFPGTSDRNRDSSDFRYADRNPGTETER